MHPYSLFSDCDGLFLSNGPGDPKMCSTAIEQLRAMIAQPREKQFPIFGICLGHQLLSLAAGAKTLKLK
jgi:carbamoylphosphate synthase small subunit